MKELPANEAIVLASSEQQGPLSLGIVPVQWAFKVNQAIEFGIIAGLDTHGLATGRLERLRNGLYLKEISLKSTAKLSAEIGWDTEEIKGKLKKLIPSLKTIDVVVRAEIVGTVGIGQDWFFGRDSKTYFFGGNASRPTLNVQPFSIGRLDLEAEVGVEARGWAGDLVDDLNDLVDVGEDVYVEVVQFVYYLLGFVTGEKVKRVRKPEVEIPKEWHHEWDKSLIDITRELPAIRVEL
ncbi:hypothetical protein [Novipirellula aureliae]|uniref:hypothetical protein n=1 Tax=Novipirellula aureliae TaxID=2527966 RepID=UPI0011B55F2C|nr:hypothetical protein [Novipirellula aureliae]